MNEAAEDRRPYALVVDDEPIIRMLALDILQDAGFRSHEADSVDGALAILRKHYVSIALLFTDVDLIGDKNGFALAQQTSQAWPHIDILVASGRTKPRPGDMPDGAYFVGKPFSAEVVHARLRQMLPNDRKPEALKD